MRLFGLYIGRYQGQDQFTRTPVQRYYDPTYVLSGKTPQWVTIDNQEFHLYRTTSVLQKVINKKATLFSNGVFCHYRTGSNGKPERIENSELIKALDAPNPVQSRSEWLMEEMVHRCVWGNSFVNPIYATRIDAYPKLFWNLPPQYMILNRTGKRFRQHRLDGIIENYTLQYPDGSRDTYETKEVIHGKIINPADSLCGLSPIHGLQMPLSNLRAAMGMRNVVLTENGALGFISHEPAKDVIGPVAMTEEQRIEIEKQFSKTHGQFEDQARVRIINHAAKWNPMTYPMQQMQVIEEVNQDTLEIIDAYQMNIHVFSNEKGSTYANAQEGKKSAYQDAIIPYANDLCFNMSRALKLIERGEWLDLDYSHVECLQEDQDAKAKTMKTKSEAYKILAETGDFQSEELRNMLGLEIPKD